MNAERAVVLRIAEAVSDGSEVDWDRERASHPEIVRALRELETIARIGTVNREGVRPVRSLIHTDAAPATERLPDRDEPPSHWGPLRIDRLLGRGTCGDVYEAYDPMLKKGVALKLLRTDPARGRAGVHRFLEEARRLARVEHDNLLVVHNVAEHEGRVGLSTELIQGRNLEELLAERGPLSPEEATVQVSKLARAVAAVHAAGLVHRDIKTSNVMREDRTGRIVLMDFSSALERSCRDRGETTTMGTPTYMAPELFEGALADPRSDIYALGVVLFRLVTGSYPVDGRTLHEIHERHRRSDRSLPRDARPDLHPVFANILERALSPDPGQRFDTAGEFEQALNHFLGAVSPPRPREGGGRRRPGFRRWTMGLVAPAAAVVLAVLIWRLLSSPAPLEVQASLFRHGRDTDERLSTGATVQPGDQLFLEVSGSDEMFVYVVNEDDRGGTYVLFPAASLDLANPLKGDVTHRLPGPKAGTPYYWDVSSAGGTETILVIASASRLPEVEGKLASLAVVDSEDPLEVADASTLVRFRGIGGLSPDDWSEEDGPASIVSDLQGQISVRTAHTREVWMWEIVLPNPGP